MVRNVFHTKHMWGRRCDFDVTEVMVQCEDFKIGAGL